MKKRIAEKDFAIHHQALLNRLCDLYAGKKEYREILDIAKQFAEEDFEFCYPFKNYGEETTEEGDVIIDASREPYV